MNKSALHVTDAGSLNKALRDLGNEDAFVFLEVTRKQIETMNVGSLVDRLMAMSDSRVHTLRLANKVSLSVSGWDFDPRELYEIPEVVHYFRRVADQWNYWLYFLDYEHDALGVFVRLMIDLDRQTHVSGQTLVAMRNPEQAPRLMQRLFDGFNALAAMHAFDEETIVRLGKRYASVLALQFG
ncbi:MAG: hypothetical protein ACYC9P_07880 [Rudaea sp.]